jgi:hypothetical protein
MGGGRGKENDNEWKNIETLHPYRNITQCTVSCWIIGKHEDRERVRNGGLIWLNHDIYTSEMLRHNPLWILIYTLKNEG